MANLEAQFLLIAINGTTHRIAAGPAIISVITRKRGELSALPQWRAFYFQIRTPEGYKAMPILPLKKKNNK